MTATTAQVRYAADLYRAASTPVAASLVISICDQLDEAKESINALTLALEVERDAANLYAKQVAHWIEKHDALLAQQLDTAPATTTQPSQARELSDEEIDDVQRMEWQLVPMEATSEMCQAGIDAGKNWG